MEYYAGIDVSLECSTVCVVDGSGKIVREAIVGSEPEPLIGWFGSLGLGLTRVGLEAGPLSQWLYAAIKQAGLAVELLETRHVDVENSLRGILRGFGLKVGKTTDLSFAGRIQELVKGHPNLEMIAEALLSVRAVLLREFNVFEKRVRAMSRLDAKAKLLMSTPAVGPIVSLTYAAAVDDPARFKSSKRAGAHFGLTPKRYQSGETDYSGRISKIGDASVREALYQAAHVMLTKPVKGCPQLKSWAMRIARRAGMSKAKVALARKLAVIMHRMLKDGVPFNPVTKATTATV